MPFEKESDLAATIRKRLYKKAVGDVRVGTLDRFFKACEDILSGKARDWAASAPPGSDPKAFRSRKLNPTTIHKYVEMRFAIDENERRSERVLGRELPPSVWTGPRRGTVQSDPDMMLYIEERIKSSAPKGAREPERVVHKIIDGIENAADQSALRQAMEDRYVAQSNLNEAQGRLDMVLHAFKQLTGFDYEQVADKKGKIDPNGPLGTGLGPADREVFRHMAQRFYDNGFLAKFDLVNKNGRIRMVGGDGSHLIFPEEMSLVQNLGRWQPS